MKNFLKGTLKWGGLLLAAYVGGQLLDGISSETKLFWIVAGLALAVAYVDGSLKDRISDLEYRVNDLSRRLSRYE